MRENDIAVIGMGCVFPGALDLDQYWSNMVNGVDSITEMPKNRLNGGLNFEPPFVPCLDMVHMNCMRGGFIPDDFRVDPVQYGILPKNIRDGDPDQAFTVAIIDAALRDAGIHDDNPARELCDVIVGRGGYITNKMSEGYFHIDLFPHLLLYLRQEFPDWDEAQFADFAQRMFDRMPPNAGPDSTATSMPNLVASRAANRLNLRGAAYTVDGACASSLLSVEHAVVRLRAKQCDLAVACGVQLVQSPTFWGVFYQLGAISKSSVSRPFDRRADGLLIGEGGGAVVLKRWEDARRDGDRVYAVIKGVGSSSDGRGSAILTPLSDGQALALKRAYRDAGVAPESVGYVEAHGTGTEIGDPVEIQTLKAIYGARSGIAPVRALGSVKSMIGHLMAGAGIASFIRTVLAVSNKTLPPSLHCDNPHPAIDNTTFFVNDQARPWIHATQRGPRRAGVNAFGFGGINVHVVLEEVPEETCDSNLSRPFYCPAQRFSELFAWSAKSPLELIPNLKYVALALDNPVNPTLAELSAAALREVDAALPCRLALITTGIDDFRTKLASCIEQIEQGHTDFNRIDEVFFATSTVRPRKVAAVFPGFTFPGLGGSYAEHLMTLCMHFPELRQEFDKIEARDECSDDPVPTSLLFSPPVTLPESTREILQSRIMSPQLNSMRVGAVNQPAYERNIALAAVATANWAGWKLLQTLGVAIDCVVGQSLGDLAATCAAGIVDFDHVIPGIWVAQATTPPYLGDGRLAGVFASEEQLAPFLADASETHIALHIAPRAQVIGGPSAQLEPIIQKLSADGIIAQMLPLPPMHTAECSFLDDVMARGMDAGYNEFREAQLQIYSCVTEQEYPRDKAEIREMAIHMLNRPVRYWQTLSRMHQDGVRVFIEAGNGGLASTIRAALPNADAVVASVDEDGVDPLTQVHKLCATLFASGVELDMAKLHAHRKLRQLDLDDPTLGIAAPQSRMLLPLRLSILPFGAEIFEKGRQMVHAVESPSTEVVEAITHLPGTTERHDSPELPDDEMADSEASDLLLPSDEPPPDIGEVYSRPFQREFVEFVPGERVVIECILDLDRDLFLRDHVFIQVQDYKPIEECMPLFPMAAMVEAMSEAAECLAPDLGIVGVEEMRALRWVAFRDQKVQSIRIEARVESTDVDTGVVRVRTELFADGESKATAFVLFGRAYEETLGISFSPRDGSRSWEYTADEIYRDRHAFHGPRLQCITQSCATGARGGDAVITILPVDEWFIDDPDPQMLLDIASLDGVAQVLGGWVRGYGKFTVPIGFQKLELYQHTPPPGTKSIVRIEMTKGDESSRAFTFDVEVQDGNGNVWMRFQGFSMWAFDWTIRGIEAQREPERVFLSERHELAGLPADALVVHVSGEHVPGGNFDWITRLCMTHPEIDIFNSLDSPRRKRQWLFGRLAAKDAVRMWLQQEYGIEFVHPLSFAILNDEAGRPFVELPGELPDPPQISISHAGDCSFAAAAAGPIGIDAEPAGRSVLEIMPHFARESEAQLLEESSSANGLLRLWCAKEAVGKVLGTGLNGTPKDFEAIDFETDGRLLIYHHPSSRKHEVGTVVEEGFVIAYSLVEPIDSLIDSWQASVRAHEA
jgi:acyl transferase domain-containing protein/phosphopantetheinyl transferase